MTLRWGWKASLTMEQEKHWQQNQNQNFRQQEQMSGMVNPRGEGMGIQQAQHGFPVPTEVLIRAGWEKLMNQGGTWWTQTKTMKYTKRNERPWKIMIQNMEGLISKNSNKKVELLKEYVKEKKHYRHESDRDLARLYN